MTLSVIGVGLGRTGTTSLKLALNQLGFGPCFHMTEMMANPSSWPLWQRACKGEDVDWEEAFAGYRSSTDDPGTLCWKKLIDRYPTAKIILTVRDPERWFASGQASAVSETARESYAHSPPEFAPILEMNTAMGWDPRDPKTHDKGSMTGWLARHNAEVRAKVAPDRLLVFDVKEGWAPLCKFLNVSVPDTPFPRVNTSAEFVEILKTGVMPESWMTKPT